MGCVCQILDTFAIESVFAVIFTLVLLYVFDTLLFISCLNLLLAHNTVCLAWGAF